MKKTSLNKRISIIAIILLTFTFSSTAQSLKTPEDAAKRSTFFLTKFLSLEETQVSQISDLMIKFHTRMKEIAESQKNPEDRRKAILELGKKRDKGLKENLTQDQWNKLLEHRKKQAEKRRELSTEERK